MIKTFNERIAEIDKRLRKFENAKTDLQFLINTSDQVTKGLETPDASTKVTPLTQLIRSAQLKKVITATTGSGNTTTDDTYTLRFTIAANGTAKIKQWLFLDAKVRHSAGARVAYQLFDKNGLIVQANSFQFYYDWKSSEQVRACLDNPCLSSDEKKKNYVVP